MTWLERVCAIHESSERAAVIGEQSSVTGRELIGKTITAADLLVDLDVPAGQPVPGLLTTSADALALLIGGAAANRPLAPLGPRQTAAELAETVRRTGLTLAGNRRARRVLVEAAWSYRHPARVLIPEQAAWYSGMMAPPCSD